jgi:flagellar protein FlbT
MVRLAHRCRPEEKKLPLLIDLKPGEKIIVNGAVIENAGGGTKIRIHNHCNVLRQKEVLSEHDVVTPAARVYFCLQNAYVFSEQRERHLLAFERYLKEYVEACPSAIPVAEEVVTQIAAGRDYHAIKAARKLLQHESMLAEYMRLNAAPDVPPSD